MRNLWLFLINYYAFFIFLFLEIICFILIINNNNYQGSSVINSANDISGNIYTTVSNLNSYLHLREINDSLVRENSRLKNLTTFIPKDSSQSNLFIRDTNLRFIPARVVNNSVIYRNNYLTLNKGRESGIHKNMGVICSSGIVGIVKDVSEHFCTVISLLHKDIRISAKINKSNEFGSLVWNGTNPFAATLIDIPTHIRINKGDLISTTGFSSIFPEGVPIGHVESFGLKKGEDFLSINVNLSTDFSRLSNVYIIDNALASEKLMLENNLPKK